MGVVYCATNKINGKKYIGFTSISLKHRKGQHLAAAQTENGASFFHYAIRKYGAHNFEWEEVFTSDDVRELKAMEKSLISENKSLRPGGYNLTHGGEGNVLTEETKRKIGAANKGRKPTQYCIERALEYWKTHQVSEETRKKLRGRKVVISQEMRDRISKKLMGHKHSEETKRKIGEAGKGKNTGKNNHKSRMVMCVETGQVFETLTAAAKHCGGSIENIYRCASGRNKTAFGFKWEYVEKE
jgi:group I intron endonuclease